MEWSIISIAVMEHNQTDGSGDLTEACVMKIEWVQGLSPEAPHTYVKSAQVGRAISDFPLEA